VHGASRLFTAILTIIVCLASVRSAFADFITYNLDQSNTLADGVVYGTVKVEASAALGEVKITYTADPSVYASTGKNFGLHTVGFNTDLSLNAAQIAAPSGWKLTSNSTLSTFGKFSWKASTSNSEAPTVVLDITGLGSNATLAHFTLPSSGGESQLFAAHVIDFVVRGSDTTSHWIGGSSDPPVDPPPPGGQGGPPQAPEPSSLSLSGLAIAAIATRVAVRRRRRVQVN
jgi:hypothetical protein